MGSTVVFVSVSGSVGSPKTKQAADLTEADFLYGSDILPVTQRAVSRHWVQLEGLKPIAWPNGIFGVSFATSWPRYISSTQLPMAVSSAATYLHNCYPRVKCIWQVAVAGTSTRALHFSASHRRPWLRSTWTGCSQLPKSSNVNRTAEVCFLNGTPSIAELLLLIHRPTERMGHPAMASCFAIWWIRYSNYKQNGTAYSIRCRKIRSAAQVLSFWWADQRVTNCASCDNISWQRNTEQQSLKQFFLHKEQQSLKWRKTEKHSQITRQSLASTLQHLPIC